MFIHKGGCHFPEPSVASVPVPGHLEDRFRPLEIVDGTVDRGGGAGCIDISHRKKCGNFDPGSKTGNIIVRGGLVCLAFKGVVEIGPAALTAFFPAAVIA